MLFFNFPPDTVAIQGGALCTGGQHSTFEVEPRPLPLDFPLFLCVITFSSSADCLQICAN